MVAISAADEGTTSSHQEAEPLLIVPPVKLPQYHSVARAAGSADTSAAIESSEPSSSWLFLGLQVVLVVSLAVYTIAHTIFPSPYVQLVFFDKIGQWWTETTADGQIKVHFEMERPGFIFLFCVVPFAVGTIALEWMRGPQNLHRVVSHRVLRVGMVLRRKPSPSGGYLRQYFATFSYGELFFLALLVFGNSLLLGVGWVTMLHYYPVAGKEYTVYTTLEILGIVMGYNCVYNMAFLFLPTTRNSAWMEFLGISYPNGMKFHRWLGVATVVTAIGHGLPFYPVWFNDGVLWEKAMPCWDCSLDYLSKGYPAWFNVFGEISLFFMLILAATSLPWIRRNMYETFYYAHYLFVPTVVFAVLHWGTVVWWLLPSFTIYLVDRVVGTMHAFQPVPIDECSVLSDGILKIVVKRSTQQDGDFEVGQFVYLNVPAISKWQWHAFTIGSSPRGSATTFTIWLKSLGDWTEDLLQYANECQAKGEQPVMYVDGYYGASLESYDQYATLCLVGGGIGVTPLFAMLEDIANCRSSWPQSRRIHFVFSFRELALLEEIHPVLQKLRASNHTRDIFSWDFYLTRVPRDEMLDSPLTHDRKVVVSTKPGQHLLQDNLDSTHRVACPFAEPLRGRTYRAVLYATVIVGSSAAIFYLDYDGGVMMDHGAKTQYWPLQNLVDCLVLFAIAPVAYLFILAEKLVLRWTKANHDTTVDTSELHVEGDSGSISDIATYRDLLAEYKVAVGSRPDMRQVIGKVHADYKRAVPKNPLTGSDYPRGLSTLAKTVGVYISGPEALKRATEHAISAIDSSCFDVHDEEFEL